MIRTVVERTDELLLDNCTASSGYAFDGDKGTFILAKDTNGKFIWVRLTPGKVGKPVHEYDSVKEAIKSKMDLGFDVYAYDEAELR
jgi:hypothetical protein